ncbi:MAG: hypothetical protein Q8P33_03435 [bacterium]|nr:hypothetical protein [bacterium]
MFHKLLARYKERGLQAMRPLLVRRLVQQLCVAGLEQRKPVLVHVPCSRARIRQRGFDQAAALAAGLAKQTGLKHAALLGRIKSRSKPQKNLTVLTRRANAKGLYAVLPSEDLQIARLRGVLLVDDVATSLATLETCAMQLRRAGIRDVRAVVLAYAALT